MGAKNTGTICSASANTHDFRSNNIALPFQSCSVSLVQSVFAGLGRRLVPRHLLVIESSLDRRLDDCEERRNVEVARRVQRMVADVQDLASALGVNPAHLRQDWI